MSSVISPSRVFWDESGSSETSYADPVVSTAASTGDTGRSPALTTDSSGNWLLADNDGDGISYARYDGSAWSTTSVCFSSDACDSDRGIGVGEETGSGVHLLNYNEAAEQLVHTRHLSNITTMASVTGQDPRFFSISRDPATEELHLTNQQLSGKKLMHMTFNGTGWSDPVRYDIGRSTLIVPLVTNRRVEQGEEFYLPCNTCTICGSRVDEWAP